MKPSVGDEASLQTELPLQVDRDLGFWEHGPTSLRGWL
jgi:hypothetical protein